MTAEVKERDLGVTCLVFVIIFAIALTVAVFASGQGSVFWPYIIVGWIFLGIVGYYIIRENRDWDKPQKNGEMTNKWAAYISATLLLLSYLIGMINFVWTIIAFWPNSVMADQIPITIILWIIIGIMVGINYYLSHKYTR